MQQFLDGLISRWGIQADWLIVLVYAVGMLLFAVVLLLFASIFAGFASFFERRIAARMQSRVGPNRVGPNGILQWVADGLKCLLKEDLIPKPLGDSFQNPMRARDRERDFDREDTTRQKGLRHVGQHLAAGRPHHRHHAAVDHPLEGTIFGHR